MREAKRERIVDIPTSFETPAYGGLLRMRTYFAVKSETLMVRSRAYAASPDEASLRLESHEAPACQRAGTSFADLVLNFKSASLVSRDEPCFVPKAYDRLKNFTKTF